MNKGQLEFPRHLINFQNLELLSTKKSKESQLEFKFRTPNSWKRVNLNNGQHEFPIHDIQSLFKIWNSYPQNLNLNLKGGQLKQWSTWISNSWHSINFSNLELLSTKIKIWIWAWTSILRIPIRKWRARFLREFKVFYITESQPQCLINFQNLVRLG